MKTSYSPEDFEDLGCRHHLSGGEGPSMEQISRVANAVLPAIKEAWLAELEASETKQKNYNNTVELLVKAQERMIHLEKALKVSSAIVFTQLPCDCGALRLNILCPKCVAISAAHNALNKKWG